MASCPHTDRTVKGRVCRHLPGNSDPDHVQRFTGVGLAYDLVCEACSKQPDAIDSQLVEVCAECFETIEKDGAWEGILGRPELRVAASSLSFQHETLELPLLAGLDIMDVQAVEASEGRWIACTSTGSLIEMDVDRRSVREAARIPADALDFDGPLIREARPPWLRGPRCLLRVSDGGELAAVANTYGERGVVVDLVTGRATMNLRRGRYHEDVCVFPLAFCELNHQLVVIHATHWNRLDASDARTGVLLRQRKPTPYSRSQLQPLHYLDYFHCGLTVSPGRHFIADNGWIWQPLGIVTTWNVHRWLNDNVWESEDGPSRKRLCWRAYHWDGPLCWIDDRRLAVWGYGLDDDWMIPAVQIFDVRSGQRERWFAGPKGSLVFDEYLFAFDPQEGMAVWDPVTGERLLQEPGFCPAGYHPRSKHFLSLRGDGRLQVSRLQRG